jgi:hypothetical protein
MYETAGAVWAAGVVFAFIILLTWFFVRTLRWIVKGFDLWDDNWMSLRGVENKRHKLLSVLQEDDVMKRREKLRAVVEGRDPDHYQMPKQEDWWHRNFPDLAFTHANSARTKLFYEYKLYGFILILILFGTGAIVGLVIRLLGSPLGS